MNTVNITCPRTGKKVYGTLARALRESLRVAEATGREQRVYRCEFCGWLHFTTQPYGRRHG